MSVHEDTESERGSFATSPTAKLNLTCLQLWGEDWAAPLAEFLGLNLRTCQRLRAAARVETENPKAEGIVSELSVKLAALSNLLDFEALDLVVPAAAPYRIRLSDMKDWVSAQRNPPDPHLWGFRSVDVSELNAVLDEAEAKELVLEAMTSRLIEAENAKDMAEKQRLIHEAIALGSQILGGVVVEEDDWTRWAVPPVYVFADRETVEPRWEDFVLLENAASRAEADRARWAAVDDGYFEGDVVRAFNPSVAGGCCWALMGNLLEAEGCADEQEVMTDLLSHPEVEECSPRIVLAGDPRGLVLLKDGNGLAVGDGLWMYPLA